MSVELSLLLFADSSGFLAEVDGGRACLIAAEAEKLIAAEDKIVKYCNHRQQVCRERTGYNAQQEEHSVKNRQILHLYGDNKEQQHLNVGEEGGEREEHAQINILGGQNKAGVKNEVDCEAINYGKQYACEKVDGKLRCAPVLFKGVT